MDRRNFLKQAAGVTIASLAVPGCMVQRKSSGLGGIDKPNIILVMADDLGWGDVGYNGNVTMKTPELDRMARETLRFDRFYAAFPVCSPTRGSCLTGRHPYRYNIQWAGEDPLPMEEVTIAEVLKTNGYATGHFGKWHVGAVSKTVKQSYFPGDVDPANYSPPWENGFEECFSTASMMPTYNPYYHVGGAYGTEEYRFLQDVPVAKGQQTDGNRWRDHYWTGPGQIVDEWLEGDDSEIIMDRALDFIERKAKDDVPFLSAIWFHTPHTPIAAGDEDRKPFADQPMDAQHWFGCVHAMDRQVGRLREELRKLGIADNTIIWFCSDNGPSYIHDWNSSGGLAGKKATLWEGGIRVPAVLEWPKRFKIPKVINAPICTSDFYPTLLTLVGVKPEHQPVLDGIDVMPILDGPGDTRPEPIAFQAPNKRKDNVWAEEGSLQLALIDNQYKLLSFDGGKKYQLFDLVEDKGETKDISAQKPERVKKMKQILDKWQQSCADSAAGKDYSS